MFDETIEKEHIVMQEGTSEGTQIKYKKDMYWYKLDHRGKEGLVEYLVSHLLTFSSLDESEYIRYETGVINGKNGCRSRNFLSRDEELITFYRLYFNIYGKDLSQVLSSMDTMEERIEYVIAFIKQSCNLDVRDYLSKVMTVDMLVLNEDRHLNNLAVIMRGDTFVPAPVFDHGVSLLTANESVNWHFSVAENVKRVIARPFCGSHEKMVAYLGKGFSLNANSALDWLDTEPDSREKEVLQYQVIRYKQFLNLA